ncbi:MAG TPA: hypothetical protein VEF35_07105 [Candidatus Bathyarchaeia archaeon]|nr:hypothetical protein [Candidatus Bathyarchaeia archaeon]
MRDISVPTLHTVETRSSVVSESQPDPLDTQGRQLIKGGPIKAVGTNDV